MKSAPIRSRRSPNGVVTQKPIPVRLLPAERTHIERLATREQRSRAAVCRLLLLRGLADLKRSGGSL